jgi:hypothetical protein
MQLLISSTTRLSGTIRGVRANVDSDCKLTNYCNVCMSDVANEYGEREMMKANKDVENDSREREYVLENKQQERKRRR